METKLTRKQIKEMCGDISFKKGETFYHKNKVQFQQNSSDSCEALVMAGEEFQVSININEQGDLETSCSCPTLASFQKDCQHIAAVLIALYHKQTAPQHSELAEGLLSIFQEKPKRSSGQQLHFEDRQVLNPIFTCTPITGETGQMMLGIDIQIEATPILNISNFLECVGSGKRSVLSLAFTYDPRAHCFQREADQVIHEMIQVNRDEELLSEQGSSENNILIVPPTSWKRILPLLTSIPQTRLKYGRNAYQGLQVSNKPLDLHFEFQATDGDAYQLIVTGLDRLVVLTTYEYVLCDGQIFHLNYDDCVRLANLQEMLFSSKTNHIPIPKEQVHFFLEKILPGLKKLGTVTIASELEKKLVRTPLVAKLFLDRVKNRLLVGLEFHYGRLVINPLGNSNITSMIVRDTRKEEAILSLIEESELANTDEGYFLHNEELEYEFLTYTVPKLQKLTEVYATTAVRNRIFKGHAPPKIRVKFKKERTNWLEFKFEMDGIPETQIRELLQALEEKRKYYRLRNGSLLSLETKEFEEMKRFLNSVPLHEDADHSFELPLLKGIAHLDSIMENELFTPEQSFRQFLKEMTDPDVSHAKVPENLTHILRDYQKKGYQWMKTLASYGFGGILADDMGLGKTLQSITYIQSVVDEIRKSSRPVLIVCPSSVTYNWLSEIKKFTPGIEAVVMDGGRKQRTSLYDELKNTDVFITSYTLLRKDLNLLEREKFHTVFFDEAQSFKNPTTQTAKAVKKIQAHYRFALTGTPVENSSEELWSIYHVVFPELFRGLKSYANLTSKQIARRTRPFLLRRMKEDVLEELPEKIALQESVDLVNEQKKLYAAYLAKLRHDTLKHLDKDTIRKNRIRILAGLTRLRQICCHPALFVDGYKGRSAKFEKLMQIVEEAKLTGRRVLIFSQFTKMLDLIGRELAEKGEAYFYLDGNTPSEERIEICNRFNQGENSFFLISLKAGGTGLNLTGADTVILYDIWWNPAVEEQAADRAHRIGQENTVKVIKLISRGTIEEKMDQLQDKKRHLIDELVKSSENKAWALTDEDIRDLLEV
ncbi:DEAD/DEAH box helicase [Robertmurraya massiliosenegalensis]|uniref:DEAD/DEAH box helicase n=1 Tax=Robertmurraya TaxID=2837507 RepID=UPI0039A4E51E